MSAPEETLASAFGLSESKLQLVQTVAAFLGFLAIIFSANRHLKYFYVPTAFALAFPAAYLLTWGWSIITPIDDAAKRVWSLSTANFQSLYRSESFTILILSILTVIVVITASHTASTMWNPALSKRESFVRVLGTWTLTIVVAATMLTVADDLISLSKKQYQEKQNAKFCLFRDEITAECYAKLGAGIAGVAAGGFLVNDLYTGGLFVSSVASTTLAFSKKLMRYWSAPVKTPLLVKIFQPIINMLPTSAPKFSFPAVGHNVASIFSKVAAKFASKKL
jgi:hypothetical protein